MKGGRGLVKDRARSRVQVMPAMDARPRLPTLRGFVAAKHALRVALRAMSMFAIFGVAVAPEPFDARRVVGKLAHELHNGVLRIRGLRSNRAVPANWGHDVILLQCSYTVKG